MNLRLSLVCCLLCVLCASAQASGSTDEKYQYMLASSPELKDADQAIKDTLDEARKILGAQDYAEIEKIQDNWIKNEFTGNVQAYMREGLSEAEAWAMEIGSHADTLNRAVEILWLRREGKDCEGVYEYINSANGKTVRGIMLVKRVEQSHTVTIEVTVDKAEAGNDNDAGFCSYAGEGTLKDNILITAIEDAPEAEVRVEFNDRIAKVTATPAANQPCLKGVSLDGVYSK